jgi:hypothetical protein
MLDQQTIRKYFHYDPITGNLHRQDKPNTYTTYSITGEYLSFKGKLYSTARVIYSYMVDGELPKVVMRVDRDTKNNKWSNFTTPVVLSTNRVTGKAHIQPSAQKRPSRLSKKDIMEMFRWEQGTTNAEGDLYFIYNGANKLVTKTNITLRGVKYTRMYIIKRVRQLTLGWDNLL